MLLSDQKVNSLALAGETADSYVLAHKDNRYSRGYANHSNANHKSAFISVGPPDTLVLQEMKKQKLQQREATVNENKQTLNRSVPSANIKRQIKGTIIREWKKRLSFH